MSAATYAQVDALVATNNQSTTFSTELLVCQIWKESSFNPSACQRQSPRPHAD